MVKRLNIVDQTFEICFANCFTSRIQPAMFLKNIKTFYNCIVVAFCLIRKSQMFDKKCLIVWPNDQTLSKICYLLIIKCFTVLSRRRILPVKHLLVVKSRKCSRSFSTTLPSAACQTYVASIKSNILFLFQIPHDAKNIAFLLLNQCFVKQPNVQTLLDKQI